jgi:hypothetical protein
LGYGSRKHLLIYYFFFIPPAPLGIQGGQKEGVSGEEWWAIEELNLWLLPCGGGTRKGQGEENNGFSKAVGVFRGNSVFDVSRYF